MHCEPGYKKTGTQVIHGKVYNKCKPAATIRKKVRSNRR